MLKGFLQGKVARNNDFLRSEALAALLRHRDDSVLEDAELELLNGDNAGYSKSNLMFALTRAVSPSRSTPDLEKALLQPDTRLSAHVAEVLYQTNSQEAIPALLDALDDGDANVQFVVMQGLGNLSHQ